jgi:hypothetical protein
VHVKYAGDMRGRVTIDTEQDGLYTSAYK